MAPTLLIVDDDDRFRAFAWELLELEGFRVVGTAADGLRALVLARRVRPDVVLLDIQIPEPSGFDVARMLSAEQHGPAVVLTSGRSARDYGQRLSECRGVAGFVPKAEVSGERLLAILGGHSGAGA